MMEELQLVRQYLLRNKHPDGCTKTDKANKCRQNFKLLESVLYYRRNVPDADAENEPWRTCIRTEE